MGAAVDDVFLFFFCTRGQSVRVYYTVRIPESKKKAAAKVRVICRKAVARGRAFVKIVKVS